MHKGMWLLLAAVSVTCLSLATFWFASSYGDGSAPPEAVSNADSDHAADGVGEGIKVHGDWELTVSDPDGSNAMVYNFENKLHSPSVLAFLMLPSDNDRAERIEDWWLYFWRDPGSGTSNKLCWVNADVDTIPATLVKKPQGIVLKGSCSMVADPAGLPFTEPQQLTWVTTYAITQDNIQQAAGGTTQRDFTKKNLAAAITVSPGQLIAATVKITFE